MTVQTSYQKAKELGYSDEEIVDYLSKKNPDFKEKYQKGLELGFEPEKIIDKATIHYENEKKKLQEAQEEDLDREIERHTARLTSRAIEQVLGAPGNIRDFAKTATDYYQKTDQLPKSKFLEKFKPPAVSEELKKLEEKFPITKTISNLLDYLPTSSQIKKKGEELSQGLTTPKNDLERIGDEVFEKLVSNALPGQGPRNIFRNIAAPIVGVLGKEGVKYLGGNDKSQALTELGLNIALPLMAGNAPQLNRNVWRDVQRNVPNVQVPTNNLYNRAVHLRQRIKRGLGSRSENQATTTLDRLIDKLQTGNISADELMASNISLNEIVGDPELFGRGGHWFEEIRGIIRDGMEQVGQHAPEWYQQWQHANEIHGAIANSNYIANTIKRHTEPLVSQGARELFHAAAHGTAKTAAAIPPVYLIYKGTQVLNRMAASPQLMRYYTNVLTNSLRGNTASVAYNLHKLDQALLEQEKKEAKPPFKNSSQMKSPSSKK